MNNSKLALDNFSMEDVVVDRSPELRQREGELVKVIEAMNGVVQSQDWSSLKTLVFDGVVRKLEKDLFTEAKKDNPDTLSMARLNGQLVWARKYSDLGSLVTVFRNELVLIRKQLYGTKENTGSN